jgi:predicted cupin superfamily sugar epimerase
MSELGSLSAQEVISALQLEYLEGEGVWIRLLWRTEHGNAIYGLITPEDFSALHMLDEDEMWVHVAGAPVEMLVLHPDGSHSSHVLGTHLDLGHEPALRVPAKAWQGSRTQGEWSLVVCSLAPPFSGFTLAGDDTDLDPWGPVESRARGLIRRTHQAGEMTP